MVLESNITSVYLKGAADHMGFQGDANKIPHMLFLFSWKGTINLTLSLTLGVREES